MAEMTLQRARQMLRDVLKAEADPTTEPPLKKRLPRLKLLAHQNLAAQIALAQRPDYPKSR